MARKAGDGTTRVERLTASDVFPEIGKVPIKQATSARLLKIVKAAEARGAESVALLIRQMVFGGVSVCRCDLRADGDPAAALKG
jgi:hypothetical protein